jgi:hypothetical protein
MTEAISIAVWINGTSLNDGRILSKRGDGSSYWNINLWQSNLRVRLDGLEFANVSLSDREGGWIFIVVTWDRLQADPNFTLYIDGDPVTTNFRQQSMGTNDGNVYMGAEYGSENFFNGIIDDVRIYNRALTPQEVLELYGVIILPVAEAGPDQAVVYQVTLDGSGSFKDGGTIESWDWKLAHRTNSAFNRTVSGVTPTVSNLAYGFYDVTLTVTDNAASTAKDTCLVASFGQSGIGSGEELGLAQVVQILQIMAGVQP